MLVTEVNMEYITTKRGARAVVHAGHKYVLNRRGRDGRTFWRCGQSHSCSGSLSTRNDEIVSQKDTHNHPPNFAEIEVEKVVCAMKAKARATVRPAVYHDEIQAIAMRPDKEEAAAKLPSLSQLKTSLYRNRRSRLPRLPQSREDVHFDADWAKTASGEDFLMADDGQGEDKLILFATAANIKLLCGADTVYVDGTFQTCPRLFLSGFRPPSPQEQKDLLKQKAREHHVRLEPQIMLSDLTTGCRAELSHDRVQGLLFPLFPGTNEEISSSWATGCIPRGSGSQSVPAENCCSGLCTSPVCTPGMARNQGYHPTTAQHPRVRRVL